MPTSMEKEVTDKLVVAYEMAEKMVRLGYLHPDGILDQVKEILSWNDDALEAFGRIIDRQK